LGLSRQPGLFPVGRNRFALGAARGNRWIVLTRLGAEFVPEILLCLLCRFLPVGEAWFPKATHRLSLVPFIVVIRLLPPVNAAETGVHTFASDVHRLARRSHPNPGLPPL